MKYNWSFISTKHSYYECYKYAGYIKVNFALISIDCKKKSMPYFWSLLLARINNILSENISTNEDANDSF